ncbi:MAG TPA: ABC transporter ATP-binding protein [Thermoanaerobaculia bacterium]|nr:ABC transporter ATP-binding protein [Thermoanaerobaculia bacterium]
MSAIPGPGAPPPAAPLKTDQARAPRAGTGSFEAPKAPAVEVHRLLVRYGGNPKPTLEEVSFSVPRGSVYALLGRNGAGKSSLVRCLLGQQKPTSGGCSLFGEDAWKRRARLMAKVGVVPEDPDAPPSMTARELSAFCARLYPSWDRAGVTARLARFEVPATTPFGSLSKGQKALVSLSLALASSPDLLVLDDPTLGLDAVARAAFFDELVGELADRGTTVLLTSHDLAGVERMADRVGILKGGRLVLDESLESLKLRFRRLRYGNEGMDDPALYGQELSAFDAVKVKVRGWGIEAVVSNFGVEPFARFCALEGVVDAEASALSLEEIFITVVGETSPAAKGNP